MTERNTVEQQGKPTDEQVEATQNDFSAYSQSLSTEDRLTALEQVVSRLQGDLPADVSDVATKSYVRDKIASSGSGGTGTDKK